MCMLFLLAWWKGTSTNQVIENSTALQEGDIDVFWFNIFNFKIRNWTFCNITIFAESEWNKQKNSRVLLRLSEPVVGVLPNRSEWSSPPWISPVSFKQSIEDYRSALITPARPQGMTVASQTFNNFPELLISWVYIYGLFQAFQNAIVNSW